MNLAWQLIPNALSTSPFLKDTSITPLTAYSHLEFGMQLNLNVMWTSLAFIGQKLFSLLLKRLRETLWNPVFYLCLYNALCTIYGLKEIIEFSTKNLNWRGCIKSIVQMVRCRMLAINNLSRSTSDNWFLSQWILPETILKPHGSRNGRAAEWCELTIWGLSDGDQKCVFPNCLLICAVFGGFFWVDKS